ncbi:FAD/NAD(P)-binding protein [Candidatus Enterococcus ferrettii]|uniref:FAD-dependent urate hydroxylase HpyO/Asp monooxygenase CreE-like FAD/NAD(P)-binding domain-containing protein n=1 Tax=Candidatus Enterococcus ferrettii TaxID=2815324 RepID=A0ABV0EW39_9ENTE|nr:FAD/NAD(P)-binding protein [Enterococcus sp. 665A]MBO1339948.1 FAD/NAD(P)-binding protein [Enterococcus sp. 665A]
MTKIAVIGTGPYGLIMLDRLVKNYTKTEKLEILAFDPAGLGGKVWNIQQTDAVLMNSVMEHVTLFTDDSLESGGKVAPGPSLYEWSKKEAPNFIKEQVKENQEDFLTQAASLGRNDCCQRRFYGLYQQWFFLNLKAHLPERITLTFRREAVKDIIIDDKITLIANEEHLIDQVILATGHAENELSKEEERLSIFAEEQGLTYQPPKNPATVSLENIKPNEDIILRGMGLSFFDYIGLLPKYWGGTFIEKDQEIQYQPSGREGKIIIGSGRGLPYHARPVNQKRAGEDAQPQLLTDERLDQFKPGEGAEFFDLLKKEAELIYYEKKLANTSIDLTAFLVAYRKEDRASVLARFKISEELRLDWDSLLDPGKDIKPKQFPVFVRKYMAKDISESEKGNLTGAIASAIDTLKELQLPVHKMIDQKAFTPKEYWEELWGKYNPDYGFLTVGPPVIRMKQLAALEKAGIAIFLAPDMTVECEGNQFVALSKKNEEVKYVANHLFEARIPTTNLHRTLNPLIRALKERGYLTYHTVKVEDKNHESGAILVSRSTHQVIDQKNQILKNLYCYGVPVEGLDWLNASSPRPKTSDRIFEMADQIVQSIYQK